jgi:dipeptidyl-peptidase 4
MSSQKSILLEDIWSKSTYKAQSVSGFNFMVNGKDYAVLENNIIVSYDITNNEKTGTILEGSALKDQHGFTGNIEKYEFNSTETKLILEENIDAIYRRSSKSDVFIYDRSSKKIDRVYDGGKISNTSLSPDGNKVAFVFQNNLYYKDLENHKTIQITRDGVINKVINGMCDWVYEEEFGFTRAFEWAPDGQSIAFLRFDESLVPEFMMPMYEDGSYPRNETFKYPKVGEKNAEVRVFNYQLKKDQVQEMAFGNLGDMYVPRICWANKDELCAMILNRHQNHLKLLLNNPYTKRSRVLLEEKNKYYVKISDDLTFLNDGKHFIWSSEKEGFNSVYLYNMSGQEIKKLTVGNYDVLELYGVDEKRNQAYFKAAVESSTQHSVYSIGLDGNNLKNLTPKPGVNTAQFSTTFDFYSWTNSTINTPPTYQINNLAGDKIRSLESNVKITEQQKEVGVAPIEFFTFTTAEDTKLNGWMMKPLNFDTKVKHPVYMIQYSGPGSQMVLDTWKGNDYWFYQTLAQKGYIVACVDPRGTGARGEEFKKMTYLQLGKYEVIDLIEAAKYLGSLPYVNKDRIGIFGWSYGGYMSSLCILKGSDVFKAAIAVAPVTNWKWYDSIYTERYMRTPKENEIGYKDNSPVYFADQLKGSYLLIHGMGDDNVHFQHTVEMAKELITANKQFDTQFYPNKNHGINGGSTRLHLYTKITNFIMEKL